MMRVFFAVVGGLLLSIGPVAAQSCSGGLPNTFTSGTTISAAQMNANFAYIVSCFATLGANTFTGAQTLPGNPTSALQAATKQYVDSSSGSGVVPRSHIAGLTYQPNSGTPGSQIDIAAGQAADSTNAVLLNGSAMTKKIDTAWAAGTNQGSLDTGSIGNNDYYVWLIGKSDLSAFDYLTSLSATAPTMPTGYTYQRQIGYIKRASGSVVAFKTYELAGGGLDFYWATPPRDQNGTALSSTPTALNISVPAALSVIGSFGAYVVGAGTVSVITNPDVNNGVGTGSSAFPLYAYNGSTDGTGFMRVRTAGGQIKAASAGGTPSISITTFSFEWSRR